MTRKPIHRYLPLTYKPKIPGVLDGSITQSIRIDTDLKVGDFIAFHGWSGKPYHSPWSFRTPFMSVRHAEPISIRKDSIYFSQGMIGSAPCKVAVKACDLDHLASLDGIELATGEELIRVLHAMHGKGILHGKILRWDPEPIIKGRPFCFAFPHLLENKDYPPDFCGSECDIFEDCQEAFDRVRGIPAPDIIIASKEWKENSIPVEQVHAAIKESPGSEPLKNPQVTRAINTFYKKEPSQDFVQLGAFTCVKECPRCLQDPEGHCADDEIEKTSQDTPAVLQ